MSKFGSLLLAVAVATPVFGQSNFYCPFSLISITPGAATVGSAALPVRIAGSANYGAFTAEIRWVFNNETSTINTSGSNTTQIDFTIPAALLATEGTANIFVTLNTTGSCGRIEASNSLFFEIIVGPIIRELRPAFADVGREDLQLTIAGENFQRGDQVRWSFEGVSYIFNTTFVSLTQLTAVIPSARFAAEGVANVSIIRGSLASGAVPFRILAPLSISNLEPSSARAGSQPFSLLIRGAGFESTTRIRFGDASLPVIFINSSQVRVSITSNLLTQPRTVPVTAVTASTVPGVPDRVSNTVNFVVEGALSITSISPDAADEGSGPVNLNVAGRGFVEGAQVLFGPTGLVTQFVSATQLTATISAELLAQPGAPQVTVRNPNGDVSNALPFTIRSVFRLESLSPASALAGEPGLQLAVSGRGFQQGAVVRWGSTNLTTTFGSRTSLTATISAPLLENPATVPITVVNPGGAISNSLNFQVRAEDLVLTSITPGSATVGGGPVQITLTGTGILRGASAYWNATALSSEFVNRTQLRATVPPELLRQPERVDVRIGNPNGQFSLPVQFEVTIPPPAVSLTGLAPTPLPTQPVSVGVEIDREAQFDLVGTLQLSFEPNATAFPPGAENRQLAFASGGRSVDFVIPRGLRTAQIPNGGAIQQGTVAGVITVRMTRLQAGGSNLVPPGGLPVRTLTVPRIAPVILPGSVRIVNATASGFEVQLTAYSTPRDITSAQISFSGPRLEGETTFTIPMGPPAAAWFASEDGRANGGLFSANFFFTLSGGGVDAIQSVTARLTNSAGTSEPVTGTR